MKKITRWYYQVRIEQCQDNIDFLKAILSPASVAKLNDNIQFIRYSAKLAYYQSMLSVVQY
jgi:hypothetical protein